MSAKSDLSPTEHIERLLSTVPVDTPRHRALQSALDFKGSWIRMAHRLKTVEQGELWQEWGYKSLKAYCKKELQLSRGEIRKGREGFAWLESEAPELVSAVTGEEDSSTPARPVPDMETVDQLARGYRDVRQGRIPRKTYEDLKRAALDGERSSHQLRRQFKEAIPEDKRERKPPNPERHFRRALKAIEQALEDLEEMQQEQGEPDAELTERARRLRDEMARLVGNGDKQSDNATD